MAAGGNHRGIEKVLADLAAQRVLNRREERQRRVQPVRGIRYVERVRHLAYKGCKGGRGVVGREGGGQDSDSGRLIEVDAKTRT